MRIKRLEIQGFKSFADKTELELADGITAIVGPNGSGKSNLADAIKWVLGEQSVKALRGTRMEEVIFAGTKARRGLGLAEVSMVFDNSTHSLPLSFNEVALTRRLFRSGESDYYLNQAPCRLKDVQDLFLDTGVGKEAYSFIGQGRIDELLSTKPEDRRAILEEVAGIARYKARKRETNNKLADAEAALTRVRDLLHELENQLEPLQAEADKASQYLGLEQERRKVEKELILYELNMAERRRQRDEKLRQQISDQIMAADQQLLQIETEEERCRLEQTERQDQINLHNQQVYLLAQQVERLQGDRRIALARENDREHKLTDLGGKTVAIAARRSELDKQRLALALSLEQLQQSILTKTVELQALQKAVQAAETAAADRRLQQIELTLAEQAQKRQAAELAHSLWSDRSQRADTELAGLRDSVRQAEQEIEQLRSRLAALTERQQTADGTWQQLLTKQRELQAKQQAARSASEQTGRRERQAVQELAAVTSRLRLMRDMIDQSEGYQRGVRALLQAKRQGVGSLRGLVGVVGDLLTVPAELEYAIEIALGGSLQFMVTETEEAAKQGILYLKQANAGRATFLPLDTIRSRTRRPAELSAAGMPGALGFASDLVSFESAHRSVMENLLGNILIVSTLPQAMQIARSTGHQVRMVTLDGDMLLPGGSLSGGSRQQRGGGLLGRQRELTRLTEEQERLTALCQSEQSSLADASRRLQGIATQEQDLALRLRSAEAARTAAQSELASQQMLLLAKEKQMQSLGQAFQAAEQQLASCQSELNLAKAQVAAALLAFSSVEQTLAAQKSENDDQSQRRSVSLQRSHQLEVELVSLKEQLQGNQRQLVGYEERLREEDCSLQELAAERERLLSEQQVDEVQLADLLQQIERMEQQRQGQNDLLEQAKQALLALETAAKSLRQQAREQREQQEALRTGLYTTELRLSRLENECETMQARLEQDYGLADLSEVHSTLQSRTQGEEALEQLKQQIVLLGPVRVSSLSELERLRERVGFLHSQQQDLLDSRTSLEQIIQEIDQLMSKRFLDAFKDVRRAFQQTFVELFNGGEADLALVNPEDPLESGIEILAQPPGKKLQSINLLSGGEKAMTAVALLCAVLQVKPTPFCILDEIDAPLDDANTRRLMQVIRRLAGETQFVLITHSRETMTAADTLYGVTMPERGVSQLISVKLTEAGDN